MERGLTYLRISQGLADKAEKNFSLDRDLSVFVIRGVADHQSQRTEVRPQREFQRILREVALVKRQRGT